MKIKNVSRKYFLMLLTILLIFQSCNKDSLIEQEVANGTENKTVALKMTPVVEKLIEMGYDIENIIEIDDFYVAEGDLLFSKNIKDYPDNSINEKSHYYTGQTVSDDKIGDLLVFSGISEPLDELPQDDSGLWRIEINQAINDWNNISSESCIRFQLTNNEANADIKITGINNPNFIGLGWTGGFPNFIPVGQPYPEILINLAYNMGITSAAQKRNIIGHELGHAIHLRHTDVAFNNGIPIPGMQNSTFNDPLSIMSSGFGILNRPIVGFTNQDVANVNALYGDCGDIIIIEPIGLITGPNSICNNSNAVTYNLVDGTANDWSTSSNLEFLGSTSTSITVKPINNGLSSQAIITAQLSNGTSVTKTININGGPTPNNGSAMINGPSTLQYYQSGVFDVNSNNFSGYNNVEWVIFSYSFPNASQYFDVQMSGNNQFLRVVTPGPSTPEGNYTIQCRVANGCGTYYIDKVFNVRKGRPQIFSF